MERHLMPIQCNRSVEPFVRIHIENGRYLIKTVDSVSELEEVLRMRGEIFGEEYGLNRSSSTLDVDRYDFNCDHLVIKSRETGECVGTYRMLCSTFTCEFYSENEFELSAFLGAPGVKLELGRACIRREHRKGSVLSLLWRGIVQYAVETRADYLFGCSSVKTESFLDSRALNEAFLREDKVGTEWNIRPKESFSFTEEDRQKGSTGEIEIPSLLKSYLGAGARIYGEPAYDREFHCLDYLTILKLDELKSSFERRYRVEQSA
jgi:putative hemolysin